MAMRAWQLVFLMCIVSVSCRQAAKQPGADVTRFADLECRAIRLREQRFALANQIRFTQDTLLHLSAKDTLPLSDSLRLYFQEKESLLQASLQLADTIHRQLDSLRRFTFKTVDDKREFDKKLADELKKRGCENE